MELHSGRTIPASLAAGRPRYPGFAWLSLPLLLAALCVLRALNLPGAFDSLLLLIVFNFIFATLVSLSIACLAARTFLARGAAAPLMLGCGMIVWGGSGLVAVVAAYDDPNVLVTIHNSCVLVSATFHLAAAILALGAWRPIRWTGLVLPLAYATALGLVGFIAILAHAGRLPVFFVQGSGGTPVREFVLGSSVVMFATTAALMALLWQRSRSQFARWYALAMGMIAIGVLAIAMQTSVGSAVGWLGRIGQYLGSVYMLLAAIASVREARAWELPLEQILSHARQQYQHLFDLAADGVVLHELAAPGVRGNFLEVNPALCAMLGFTPQEMRELAPIDILAPEDRAILPGDDDPAQAGILRQEATLLGKDGRRIPVEIHTRRFEQDGRRLVLSVIRDMTAHRRVTDALHASEERLALALASSGQGAWEVDLQTEQVIASPRACEIFGISDPASFRTRADWRALVLEEDHEKVRAALDQAAAGDGLYHVEYRIRRTSDGAVRWILSQGRLHAHAGGRWRRLIGIISDITDHHRRRRERDITVDLLRRINAAGSARDLARAAAAFFREHSGCEAVGIRLRSDSDYPYYECSGLPADFIEMENHLCGRDSTGRIIHDSAGQPSLHCMCGDVICGRSDPARSFFTPGGSFFTNSTTEFLAAAPADRAIRNGCNRYGYESVALIPLGRGETHLGLVQLCDRRKNLFSAETVAFWERLTEQLALALERSLAEEALRNTLRRFELLSRTAERLLQSTEPQKVVEELCRSVMAQLDCHCFFNFLVDKSSDRLRLNACAGISAEEAAKIQWLDYGAAVCGCAARDGCRIVAEHIPTTSDPRTELVKSYGIRAYACHPLLGPGGEVLGTLSFGTRARDTFSEADLRLMKAVADQVAMAMVRLRGEQAVRDSERLYRAIGESIDYGVWVCAPDGRNIYASESFLKLVGITQEQCSNFGWGDVLHPDDAQRTLAAWKQCAATGGNWDIEHRYRGVDGAYHAILARGVPVKNEAGEIIYWAGINLDISRLKSVEEELRRANAAKDQFIAALSHELRTPLTPVLAALGSMVADRRLPDDVREDIAMMQRNVGLEVQLIADLLDVSRIAAGKLVIDRRPVDVAQVVRDAARICGGELDAKSQRLTIEALDEPCMVAGDEPRLHQVFWNLIRNAIKFTDPAGKITITIRQEKDADGAGGAPPGQTPASFVRIAIADTGCGIAADVLPRLFAVFEQGSALITRQFGGLGMGLAICKAVVDLHHGRIHARSGGIGQGATFIVDLPVAQAPRAEPLPPAPEPGSQEEPHRPLRILLVEDHLDTARVMNRLLSTAGHRVRTAHTVADALAAVDTGEFDLVVSDLGLPDGTGFDLMSQIVSRGKPVKGIALSGFGAPADIEKSRQAGFAEHITKPVNFRKLHAALIRVAGNNHATPSPSPGRAKGDPPAETSSRLAEGRGEGGDGG